MKKKVFLVGLIMLMSISGLFILSGCGNNKTNILNNVEDEKNIKENKPYVEEFNIEISSSQEDLKIPIKPYAKDKNTKEPIEVDGVTFEDTVATYHFYDYSISDADGSNYVTYSFKYDMVVPISYTVSTSTVNQNWFRSYAFLQANVFDYYTGELYREKNVVNNGKVSYYNPNGNNDEDMQYTDVAWNGKTYRIGLRMESSSKWDGIIKGKSADGKDRYNDTNRVTVNAYIYAPKDYDGLMVALNKNGTSKDDVLKQIKYNNKYSELLEEEKKSGTKSNELIEIEKELSKVYKLLDTQYKDIAERNKEDFYIIRVNEILKSNS